MNCYAYKQLEVPGTHQSPPPLFPGPQHTSTAPLLRVNFSGGTTEEKSKVKVNTKQEKTVIRNHFCMHTFNW